MTSTYFAKDLSILLSTSVAELLFDWWVYAALNIAEDLLMQTFIMCFKEAKLINQIIGESLELLASSTKERFASRTLNEKVLVPNRMLATKVESLDFFCALGVNFLLNREFYFFKKPESNLKSFSLIKKICLYLKPLEAKKATFVKGCGFGENCNVSMRTPLLRDNQFGWKSLFLKQLKLCCEDFILKNSWRWVFIE